MDAGSLDLEELTRRRLRPLVDVHASAVVLAVEACAAGGDDPWAASVLERLAPTHRRAMRPMVVSGLVPDVVLDLEHHRRRWRERLAGVAQAEPRALLAEFEANGCGGLGSCWREVLQRPERWLATVADAVAWVLPAAHRLLAADRPQLERLVDEIDSAHEPATVGRLLAALHARARIEDGCWQLPFESGIAPRPAAHGLVVVPTLTTPDRSIVAVQEQTVTTLFAGVSTSRCDHVALQALLGSVRAALLRGLARPRTMTELGDWLAIAASAVTYHVAALEQMQLAQRRRRGRCVTVRRTARGERLLALYSVDGLGSRHEPSVVSGLRVS